MDERVLLISPVRDEAEHIDAVVAGVESQTRPPDLWVVVDDGSSDGTLEKLEAHAARVPCLRVVSTPTGYTADDGDRLAAGGPDRAWNFGLREAGDRQWFTHLGKLDGDVVMPPEYLDGLLERFRADPQLGMAGGAIFEPDGAGGWSRLPTPPDHVTPMARLYSLPCFEAIGGMPERLGADVITTTYAKMRGFGTATFADLPFKHLRHMGTAQGALRGRARHGTYQWIVHYTLAWVTLRSLLVSIRFRPYGLSGAWFLGGYAAAALRGVPRVEDPEFRAFVRGEQRARMERALSRLPGGTKPAGAASPPKRDAGGGERLQETILRLEDYGNRSGWAGTDPYDGQNATRFVAPLRRSTLGRRVLTQVVKRSPLDLRPLLGIAPTRNATTVAWAVSAYARGSFLPDELQRDRLEAAADLLISLRLPDHEDPCWSYPFAIQTRVLNYPSTDPNTIATSFAGMALLDAFEATGDEWFLAQARGVGRFFARNVPQTEDAPGARFGYLVGDSSPIHNSNTHVCALLARLVEHGDEHYREAIQAGLTWTIERQRPDGSWPYGERADLEWVDNFHSGYVLDALRTCADAGVDERAAAAWQRGLDYWRANLFGADGTPKYFSDETYPIDNQCAAQGIQTLAIASAHDPSCLDQARRVFDWTLANMRRPDGLFYFQRRRHWINRTPHIRWAETCMFLALAHLQEAEARAGAGRTASGC
ncbi:MAG TPA: glycosyltransferase [Solirubrobacterales bacterium]|nr:glycosyltransferase [Solirubrobacterales bacterium]